MADTQVLIVGAGPVGLTAALALQSLGVDFRIVEKNPRPAAESRALGMQPRTLELFERLGLTTSLIAAGNIGRAFCIFLDGEEKVRLGFAHLETPYPGILIIPQNVTEQVLGEQLTARGGQVERSVELTALEQGEGDVKCTLRHADGREEMCQAQFVLGCDGAHSTVRKQAGLGFEGQPLPETFVLADAHIDPDWPRDEGRLFSGSSGFLLMIPFGENQWRIIAPLVGDQHSMPAAASLELITQLCDERGPPGIRPHDLAWLSMFRISTRIVERFRAGRVFVIGDAAHVHSPAGGQGMNTGMQEAFNLSWKLAMHLRGQAPDSLLDTYDSERRPHAQTMLATTERATQMLTSTSNLVSWLKQSMLTVAGTLDLVPQTIAGQISDLKVNYRHSTLSVEEAQDLGRWLGAFFGSQTQAGPQSRLAFSSGPHSGDRAPDADGLCRLPGESQRLFSHWGPALRHQVLIFAGETVSHQRLDHFGQLERELNARNPQLLGATLLRCGLGRGDEHTLFDTQRHAHTRYGARYECLYLVRPDGHIGFRSQPVDIAALDRYWASVYGT